MSVFKSIHTTSEKAVKESEVFIKNTEQYYKLKVFKVLTTFLSMIFKFAIIGTFALIAFIFIAISISSSIGEYLNNPTLGYISGALIFFLLAFIAFLMRNSVNNFVIRNLSKKYFDDEK